MPLFDGLHTSVSAQFMTGELVVKLRDWTNKHRPDHVSTDYVSIDLGCSETIGELTLFLTVPQLAQLTSVCSDFLSELDEADRMRCVQCNNWIESGYYCPSCTRDQIRRDNAKQAAEEAEAATHTLGMW